MFQHPAMQGMQAALKSFQTAPAGRPVKNVRPLILRSTDRLARGWTFVNDTPAPIQAALDKYMKVGQLPPGLAPTRTQIGEKQRGAAISKGWQRPTKRY